MDLKDRIFKVLENVKKQIVSNIQSEKITASGRTEKALKVVERGGSILLIKEAGDNAPMSTLEVGRPSGKVPKTINQIIMQWIEDKGINVTIIPYKTDRPHKYTEEERSKMVAAGAIAHKIAKEGTERHKNPKANIYSNVVKDAVKEIRKASQEVAIETIKLNK